MAARQRITTQEKTFLDQDETQREAASNIAPAVPTYARFSHLHPLPSAVFTPLPRRPLARGHFCMSPTGRLHFCWRLTKEKKRSEKKLKTSTRFFLIRDDTVADRRCRSVIAKLLGFTVAMVTLPIGSYFATVNTIFGGTSVRTGAGGGCGQDPAAVTCALSGPLPSPLCPPLSVFSLCVSG